MSRTGSLVTAAIVGASPPGDRARPAGRRWTLRALHAAALAGFAGAAALLIEGGASRRLLVLTDTSPSMRSVDALPPERAAELARLTGASGDEAAGWNCETAARHLASVVASGGAGVRTFAGPVGDAVHAELGACAEGDVVVLSDGATPDGATSPEAAGRDAAALGAAVHTVRVGDPSGRPRIVVRSVSVPSVVFAGEPLAIDVAFDAAGLAGRPFSVTLAPLDPSSWDADEQLPPGPVSAATIAGGTVRERIDEVVRVEHAFGRAGTHRVRVTVTAPGVAGAAAAADTGAFAVRVLDRPVRVMYAEGPPRYEYAYLSNLLVRSPGGLRAAVWLADADEESPQRATAGWSHPGVARIPSLADLSAFDVVVLGDVAPDLLRPGAIDDLVAWVRAGGGLVVIAGGRSMPRAYRGTALEGILPVVVGIDVGAPDAAASEGFSLRVAPGAERHAAVNDAADPAASRALWETDPDFRQYWSVPGLRARDGAEVLLERPGQGDAGARTPVVALRTEGKGRVAFVGADDFWRTRRAVGDRYFARFYCGLIRDCARGHGPESKVLPPPVPAALAPRRAPETSETAAARLASLSASSAGGRAFAFDELPALLDALAPRRGAPSPLLAWVLGAAGLLLLVVEARLARRATGGRAVDAP